MEGEIDFLVDGKISYHAKRGDLIHILAPETHYLKNNGPVTAKAVFVKAPFLPKDKINVEK
jgi:quercetin dioxygenase-like cupin family protein